MSAGGQVRRRPLTFGGQRVIAVREARWPGRAQLSRRRVGRRQRRPPMIGLRLGMYPRKVFMSDSRRDRPLPITRRSTTPRQKGLTQPYSNVRGSFLILNRTPWSPKERERKVDSDMPGKFFEAKTSKSLVEPSRVIHGDALVTIKRLGGDGFDVRHLRSEHSDEPNPSHSLEHGHLLAHLEQAEPKAEFAFNLHREVSENKKAAIWGRRSEHRRTHTGTYTHLCYRYPSIDAAMTPMFLPEQFEK